MRDPTQNSIHKCVGQRIIERQRGRQGQTASIFLPKSLSLSSCCGSFDKRKQQHLTAIRRPPKEEEEEEEVVGCRIMGQQSHEEGGRPSVAVAIDKDKSSQNALKWALENLVSRGQTITLVHVNTQGLFLISIFACMFSLLSSGCMIFQLYTATDTVTDIKHNTLLVL